MIRLEQVSVTYPGAAEPTIRAVDLAVDEGEMVLVVGPTGTGKSTLLGTIDGLVPHFTGGHLAGRVTVDGRDTRTHPPRELADVVGVVPQDPVAGFVTDTVEEELAYVMEQLAVPPATMRKRVEETLDLLGIADLRHRSLRTLSGGQQQRVAIGSVLTAHPRVLVLDEPTSALDPTAAEDVLAAVARLVHDLGTTVVLAEHRLERALHHADRVVHLEPDGTVTDGPPAVVMARSRVAPPVVRLGRALGWSPLPLTVRDARRAATTLRNSLEGELGGRCDALTSHLPPSSEEEGGGVVRLRSSGVVVRYGDVVAVREVGVDLRGGEVVALMGRNGSGKTSLLWAWQGAGARQRGTVRVDGDDPATLPPAEARRRVGLVPQTPADLLYLATVGAECAQADRESGRDPGTCRALLDRLVPGIPDDHHPRDLSEGQRLGLVLAVQLAAEPAVVLLDEPTRGLDDGAKDRLATVLRELAAGGRAVVASTHDVEFVALAADRVVVMAQGEVVADGPTAEVVVSSPAFAPQVAKVMAPGPWLTVDQVLAAVGARSSEASR